MPKLNSNRNLILLIISLVAMLYSSCLDDRMDYTSFYGERLKLYSYDSKHIQLLIEDKNISQNVIGMLNLFDEAYEYTEKLMNRCSTDSQLRVLTIAQVKNTCGGGCGLLGANGIEISDVFMDSLLVCTDGISCYKLLFYEFGRNFWNFKKELNYKDADETGVISTGFAIFLRELLLSRFDTCAKFSLENNPIIINYRNLLRQYESDIGLNWYKTILLGKPPSNKFELSGSDFFSSFFFELYINYGKDCFLHNFSNAIKRQKIAITTQDAIDNFVISACLASGEDLRNHFKDVWKWPLSAYVEIHDVQCR